MQLGTASGLANPHLGSTTNNNVNIANASILQHYVDVQINPPLGPKQRRLESVATAVIVASAPAGHTEYPTPKTYDLRLELTRNGLDVLDRTLEYNVSVVTVGSLSTNQKTYFARPASAYVTLSAAGLDPNLASVGLPPTGEPPPFRDLCAQIDKVLAKDPGPPNETLAKASPLTAAQSRQIAAEIVFNRTAEPPPDLPDSLGLDPFGAMYTRPPVDPAIQKVDDAENARGRFEAELRGWYGTRQAEALRLAGFVYSASAAVAEEVMSKNAERASFVFPIETDGSVGTISHGVVAVTETGGLDPSFLVPADYFYALAATMPAHLSPEQRYDMARLTLEKRLLSEFEVAADGVVASFPVSPFTSPGDPAVAPDQAARRLVALGSALSSMTTIDLAQPIETLVDDWLNHQGPSETIDADFWDGEIEQAGLPISRLLLEAVTEHYTPLINTIETGVDSAAELAQVTDEEWRALFVRAAPPIRPRRRTSPCCRRSPCQGLRRARRGIHPACAEGLRSAGPAAAGRRAERRRTADARLPIADAFASFEALFPGGPLPVRRRERAEPGRPERDGGPGVPVRRDAQRCLAAAIAAIDALVRLTDIGRRSSSSR